MKKMIIAAVVLLVVQIGLSLALNMGHQGIEEGAPDTLFLSFTPDAVQSISITDGDGKKIVIKKDQNGWIVPAHFSAPVNANKVKALLGKLADMKQGFVVANSADAAKRFKVDAGSFASHVVLQGADKSLADFYVGTAPVFRQAYVRRSDSKAIVTVALSSFELESAADKWLDTSIATIKDEDLVGLTMGDIKLKKERDGWQFEGLKDGEKINHKEVDALVSGARGLVIQDVLDPADAAVFFNQPVFRFTAVKKDGKKVDYLFAKSKADYYMLKLSDQSLNFKVLSLPVDNLRKVTRDKLIESLKVVKESGNSQEKE